MVTRFTIKRIAFISIFAALTSLLYCYVKFSLPIFPSFLDVNFSMIPIIIAVFMLGPIDGIIIVIIRFLMKLLLVGTGTQYVGEIADLILGLVTSLSTGVMYRYYKGNHKTLFSFIILASSWLITSIIINAFLNIPMYVKLMFDGDISILINLCSDAFKLITFNNSPVISESNFIFYYTLFAVIPFNLLLIGIVILITALVHQRLRILYDRIN